jgi:uncharacterized protein YaaQ
MKLVWAIVQNEDAGALIDALTKRQYRITRINTAGGFLRQGNATIISAVEDNQVEYVIAIIEENCQKRIKEVVPVPLGSEPGAFFVPYPMHVEVGGATVFVIDLWDYRRL